MKPAASEATHMADDIPDERLYRLARQRVRDKKDFYQHLAIYVVVNSMLALAWAFSAGDGYPWFIWALAPWGIGLLVHFSIVFIFAGKTGGNDEEAEEEPDKEVDRKKGFYRHLGLYLVANIILIVIWTRTGDAGPVPWFVFPLAGWGIFVLWNYLEVFVYPEGTGWEKGQLEKEVEKLRRAGK
jgi:cytochrome b561